MNCYRITGGGLECPFALRGHCPVWHTLGVHVVRELPTQHMQQIQYHICRSSNFHLTHHLSTWLLVDFNGAAIRIVTPSCEVTSCRGGCFGARICYLVYEIGGLVINTYIDTQVHTHTYTRIHIHTGTHTHIHTVHTQRIDCKI